jgi:spore maturation protein CgeB
MTFPLLSTYTVEQAEFFPENEAAIYYRDSGEIDDKLDRVVRDRNWAERLRHRASAIAAQHPHTERAKTITAELGL